MEPTTQNYQNEPKNTLWITIGSIIIIVLLVWGGIYLYQNRPDVDMGGTNGTSTASSTRPDLGEDDRAVTVSERSAVDAYLRSHINELSPKKAATGRSFGVTSVVIEAAGRSIVEYSDGVSTHTAAAAYKVDASGNIVITSFDILEK